MQTNRRARQHTTTRQHSATEHNTGQRNTKTHGTKPQGGEPRGQTGTAPAKHDTKTHQETTEERQAHQQTPEHNRQHQTAPASARGVREHRTKSNDRNSTTEAHTGTRDSAGHANPPRTAQPAKKKEKTRKQRKSRKKKNKQEGGRRKRRGGVGGQQGAEAQGTPGWKTRKARDNGGEKKKRAKEKQREKKKGGGAGGQQDAKAQGGPGWKTRKAGEKGGATGGKEGRQGNLSPEGAEQAKSARRPAAGKKRRTRTRPGGRPARHGQEGHAHTHDRGTRAWRPPTRRGRCRRPHKTAPVHRPWPPSKDGRYRKPDASVTGSTHENHRSARSPRPTPEGPATDNSNTGPRTGTTRSEPSAAASAAASGRHNEPGSRPASPRQPPKQIRGRKPRVGKRHHSVRKADRSTESDGTGRGAAHQSEASRHAREARRRPQPRHTDRCQATTATGCHKRGQRAQPAPNHGTGTGARKHQTHKPQTPAGKGGVQADGAHRQAHPNTPARSGGAQPKPKPNLTHPQSTPQPGVAGYKPSAQTNTHTPQHRSQEWRAAAAGQAQAHTATPHTPARSGGVHAERAHKHKHASQEWRGAAEM